jgi:hypothetical protein
MSTGKWYQNNYRRNLVDMHIEDWDDEFLLEFNPDDYFENIKKAHINAPMIYVQSHVGLCYWPTKSGVMHNSFKNNSDKIRRVFELCRNEGMHPILYYSLIFNNREYQRHPEWRMRDFNGKGSRESGIRYGLVCPNNEEYKEFVKVQIEEFCEYFDFDGVFFDMLFWPVVCYCPSCQKRYQEDTGKKEIPSIVDWKDPDWQEFANLRYNWMGEFAQFAKDELRKIKPEVSIEQQFSGSMFGWLRGNNEKVALACDYIGPDLYGGIREQSFASKTWYHLTPNKPFQYMTSRCYYSLQEHTTQKTYDQLKQCVATTFLHHGASLIIDAIDPRGTMDSTVYDNIGKVFKDLECFEPYIMKGDPSYDVGLYYNLNGKYDDKIGPKHVLDQSINSKHPIPHLEAIQRASTVLSSHQIPYTIVTSFKHELFDTCKVIVLDEVPFYDNEEEERLVKYVENGGKLYISGDISDNMLKKFFGRTKEGFSEGDVVYCAPAEESNLFGYFTYKHPLSFIGKSQLVSENGNGETLSTIVFPYTPPISLPEVFPSEIEGDPGFNAERFSTIHANPPGRYSNHPAMLRTTYGKGEVIWTAVALEMMRRYQHENIFCNIINSLMDKDYKFGSIDAPEEVEIVMFEDNETNEALVGILNLRDQFKISKLADFNIWVSSEKEPKMIEIVGDEKQEVQFDFNENKIKIRIENLIICRLLRIVK